MRAYEEMRCLVRGVVETGADFLLIADILARAGGVVIPATDGERCSLSEMYGNI